MNPAEDAYNYSSVIYAKRTILECGPDTLDPEDSVDLLLALTDISSIHLVAEALLEKDPVLAEALLQELLAQTQGK